ncbi:hypothetical protein LCGC14_2387390 [marine sediment metagenome]|uniref:Uncharacterized protein n=1 Tax=marine sediment metagenome TaxID=412755 RepID=A0A0F9CLC7_9ZZZZ
MKLISDEEIDKAWPDETPQYATAEETLEKGILIGARAIAQAQLDDDRKEMKELCGHCDTPLLNEGNVYEQIKREAYREALKAVKESGVLDHWPYDDRWQALVKLLGGENEL